MIHYAQTHPNLKLAFEKAFTAKHEQEVMSKKVFYKGQMVPKKLTSAGNIMV